MAERLFSAGERAWAARLVNPSPSLAARFAAKEAVMKALGVGLGAFAFNEVEVVRRPSGQPELALRGRAAALAAHRGVGSVAGVADPYRHPGLRRRGRPVVIPVLTPEEMTGVDSRAPGPVEALVARAGAAVASAALDLLGGGVRTADRGGRRAG